MGEGDQSGRTRDDVPKEHYEEALLGRKMSQQAPSPTTSLANGFFALFDGPVTWFRETVIEPTRKNPPVYYHQKFRRVPTVDECYIDDVACHYEANEQFKRDRKVDATILTILKNRWNECAFYHGSDEAGKCQPLLDEWKDAETNFFIKYGDLNMYASVQDAYMKQKHRMVWERRQQAIKQRELEDSS